MLGFAQAAQRLDLPVEVVSYPEFLSGNVQRPSGETLIRIESPGECLRTTRQILLAGIARMEAEGLAPLPRAEVEQLEPARGEIVHPRQWYYGFVRILEQVRERWAGAEVEWMSTPESIATAFDKSACLERWSAAGLPVPRRLPHVTGYESLRSADARRHARLFIKPRYGYSAIGAIALEWRDDRVRALTTVEVGGDKASPRLYVSKRPQALQDEGAIAWLVDKLGEYEMVVEAWLPKDRWRGRSYDLRLVTVAGQVSHVVGRASHSPFTNLNLDAQRMSEEEVRARLGAHLPAAFALACQGAACLPDATVLGIDLLVHPLGRKFSLLEANAFGDYLPGLLATGRTTYDAELEQILARRAVA